MTELTQIPVYGKWNGGNSAAGYNVPFFAGAENQLVAEAVRWALNGERSHVLTNGSNNSNNDSRKSNNNSVTPEKTQSTCDSGGSTHVALVADLTPTAEDFPHGYRLPHSPLVFYGQSGCGKTHLAHGIYQQWRQNHRRKYAVFLTGETFARSFANAIDSRTVDEFHEKTRRAELFVLDDLEQLSAKRAAMSDFLITLDILLAERRTIVLTAHHFPTMRQFPDERLVARLTAGLLVPIAPPAITTRLALLKHFADHLSVKLTQTAANLLAKGLPVSVPRLFGSLAQLALEMESLQSNPAASDTTADSKKEKFPKTIGVSAAQEAIRTAERAAVTTLDLIAKTTAKQLGLKLADLKSKSRKSTTVLGRAITVYLARQLTNASLKEIGKYFGGRDHTTIAHAAAEIEQKIAANPKLRNQVIRIQEILGEG
ncbi:MAG: AAA family ATPase [Planctomycetaceae bacterium]|jgi:chromosomal replication initiator protein|nr:AAA family ATPase [Planctomycetaceae bacterium]